MVEVGESLILGRCWSVGRAGRPVLWRTNRLGRQITTSAQAPRSQRTHVNAAVTCVTQQSPQLARHPPPPVQAAALVWPGLHRQLPNHPVVTQSPNILSFHTNSYAVVTAEHVVEDTAVRQVFLEDFLDFCQTSSTSQLLHTQNGQSTFTHQGYPEK